MQIHPRVTRASRDFVRTFEPFRAEAVRLARGGWTIGYGHRRTAREGVRISEADADALLAFDLSETAEAIEPLIFTPLDANAFDALLSFSFSIGTDAFRGSEVLRRLNRGAPFAAAVALEGWRCADIDGDLQRIDALVRRRAVEKARFLTPASGIPPFASPASPPLSKFTLRAPAPASTTPARAVTRVLETTPPAPRRVRGASASELFRSPPIIAQTTAQTTAETTAERIERVVTGQGVEVLLKRAAPIDETADPAPPPFVDASSQAPPVLGMVSPFGPVVTIADHAGVASSEGEPVPSPSRPAVGASRLGVAMAWLERSTVYAAIAILGLGLFLVSIVCILDRPTVGLLALGLIGVVAMIPAAVRFSGRRR